MRIGLLAGLTCRLALGASILITSLVHAAPPELKAQTILERATVEVEAKRFASAANLLTESFQNNANGPDAEARYLLLGQALAKQNRTDDALRSFAALVSRFPDTEWAARAIEQQMEIYMTERPPNPSEAQKLRNVLLERYPASPATSRVWTAVADQLFAEEKLADAVGIYQRFEKSLSLESEKRLRLAEILVQTNADPSKVFAAAESALKENKVTLAKTLLKKLLDGGGSKTRTSEYRLKYAWCLYSEGGADNLTESEKIWSSIAKVEPRSEWGSASRWHIIQLHAGPKNEWRKAVDLCAELAKDMPKGSFRHEQALFTRAWLLRTHKDWAKAKVAFEELVLEYPSKASHEPIIGYIGEIDENLQNPKKPAAE